MTKKGTSNSELGRMPRANIPPVKGKRPCSVQARGGIASTWYFGDRIVKSRSTVFTAPLPSLALVSVRVDFVHHSAPSLFGCIDRRFCFRSTLARRPSSSARLLLPSSLVPPWSLREGSVRLRTTPRVVELADVGRSATGDSSCCVGVDARSCESVRPTPSSLQETKAQLGETEKVTQRTKAQRGTRNNKDKRER